MTVHFIGVGGIGMSALARVLSQQGKAVQGSDMAESALLQQLVQEGVQVHIGHSVEPVKKATRVVYSTGIGEDNVELAHAKQANLPLLHRSDLLHELMQGKKALLVSGTHGKTTTTALLSWVLLQAGLDPSFVVGGVMLSLNTNGRAGSGEFFVAEADESDGSFLRTPSFGAIATSLSNDHLDYWKTEEKLNEAFVQYMAQTKHLVWCFDDARLTALKPKGLSYGFHEGADFQIRHFHQTPQGIRFDVNEHLNLQIPLSGRHNALNATAVFAMALHAGVSVEAIRKAFATFQGTGRRLEFKGEAHRVMFYDDYGHHPREIASTLSALRGKVREKRIVVVFQPHRYTRVKELLDEFTTCFQEADEVFLTDIYGAGETPIDGVSSAVLYTRMREKLGTRLHFFPRSYLEAGVAAALKPFDVVLTLGAGDITKAGPPILQRYEARKPRLKLALLFGGASSEHDVSLLSMQNVLKGIDPLLYDVLPIGITKEGKWVKGFDLSAPTAPGAVLEELTSCDVCLPVLHGQCGEDGMAAAVCTALGLAYTGCDYKAGAVSMQKAWSKYAALLHGVPTAPFVEIRKEEADFLERIESQLAYPVWVKPVHLGSSIGVSRAGTREELLAAVELAFRYDALILVEKEIVGRQIEFCVLGNDFLRVAPPGEIMNQGAFVGYDQKYGAGAMAIRIAGLTEGQKELGIELAKKIYRILGCRGLSRVDFFLDEKGCYWFNEINPMPGCTETSAYPKMWQEAGLSMGQLVDELVYLAFHAHRRSHA